jgi:Flp pilus assembly protein TadD
MTASDDAYTLYRKGREAIEAGHADEAIVPLERASAMEPESNSILEALGTTYLKVGFHQRAARVFRTIVERDPVDAFAHYCLARALDRLGENVEARQHYHLAAFFEPGRRIYRDSHNAFVARAFPEHGREALDDDGEPPVMIFGG